MLIRSLTLATLLAIAGPLFAADGDSPLDIDKGRARPLIVIAPSTVDPVWVNLKKSLEDPANKKGVADRNIRVYSVLNMSGQLDGKDLGQQDTMALIRALKLGAGALPESDPGGQGRREETRKLGGGIEIGRPEENLRHRRCLASDREGSTPLQPTPVAD